MPAFASSPRPEGMLFALPIGNLGYSRNPVSFGGDSDRGTDERVKPIAGAAQK
ncbi:MAG: hypothetical protein GDA56_16240 [Hormoscilla sp. GM7CHS1pb]|nr:hypothetical protein [Hormoscilla sp. GM7CHS1pb]